MTRVSAKLGELPPAEWNDTSVPYPADRCVHELFEDQATAHPAAPALLFEDDVLSYGELNTRANQLAHQLIAAGVRQGDPVGVYLYRGFDLPVALLAVFKAGGCYVPLDPAYPVRRADALLAESGAKVLVSTGELGGAVTTPVNLVALDEHAAAIGAHPVSNPGVEVHATDPACVLYTSGSTGTPKGSVGPHRSIVRWLFGQEFLPFGPPDVVLHAGPISWDVIVMELWAALLHGAPCVLQPGQTPDPAVIETLVKRHRITMLPLPTNLLNVMVDEYPHVLGMVSIVCTGGDTASVPHVRKLRRRYPHLRILNAYGPVESMLWATYHEIGDVPDELTAIPIGHPINNTRVFVLDEQLRPVPVGVAGEICIGGDGLAIGYQNRPELTEERFVTAPFDPAERLYRTGDLGRWRTDGELDFLGRMDHQVKVRGFRVEPAEIEHALLRQPGVALAVVTGRKTDTGARLVGYVVGEPGHELDPAELTSALRRDLPAYLVPSAVMVLAELPRSRYGKVDRAALPEPALPEPALATETAEARTEIERELVRIWCEVLELDSVGVQDDFFAVGGDSVTSFRVVARIASTWAARLSGHILFDVPTIAGLAALVERGGAEATPDVIGRRADAGPAPAAPIQRRLWDLYQADPGSAEYVETVALTLSGPLDVDALRTAFDRVIARHEALRSTFRLADGQLVQVVGDAAPVAFEFHRPETQAERDRLVERYRMGPFDLANGPVFRVGVVEVGADEHLLLFGGHYAVADGAAMALITRDLSAYYQSLVAGAPEPEPLAGPRYQDYTRWQHERWHDPVRRAEELDFWRAELAGAPVLAVPTDRPRSPVRDWGGSACSFLVDEPVLDGLYALAKAQGATLLMVLLAAFTALLRENSGQSDFVIGTTNAGRHRADLAEVVGLVLNTLPVRCRVAEGASYRDLVNEVRGRVSGAYAHQDFPFEYLVEEFGTGDRSRPPLAQAMMVLLNIPLGSVELPGVEVGVLPGRSHRSHAELNFFARDVGGRLFGGLEYATALFDEATVRRLADRLVELLAEIGANPDAPVRG